MPSEAGAGHEFAGELNQAALPLGALRLFFDG